MVRLDYANGYALEVPADDEETASLDTGDIGPIFDGICKVFPRLCGGGDDKKPPSGCYKIEGPDGTVITICPPPRAAR
jgi:hypothetical protein